MSRNLQDARRRFVPPVHDGVSASTTPLPPGPWTSLLDFLDAQFPEVGRERWRARCERGRVLDGEGRPLHADAAYRPGGDLHYYRELPAETPIPFEENVLFQDAHLLVADKPHFLPVMPAGRYVQETLLVRLKRRLGLEHLVPLHRIDRGTAGLVLFSVNPDTRGRYQQLFAQRAVEKEYEALAPWRPQLDTPRIHRSRLGPGTPFHRMREVEGEPNSETRIELAERMGELARYRLYPVTGRKHQLRVHLAALGAPIVNDDLYPELRPRAEDDYSQPLQLLARRIAFRDPLDGHLRSFESRLRLLSTM